MSVAITSVLACDPFWTGWKAQTDKLQKTSHLGGSKWALLFWWDLLTMTKILSAHSCKGQNVLAHQVPGGVDFTVLRLPARPPWDPHTIIFTDFKP